MYQQVQLINQHLKGAFRNAVLERGGRLYKNGYIKDAVHHNATKQVVASVKSESFYLDTYEVIIDYFPEKQVFKSSCTCMYGDHCKHVVAVFIYISEALWSGKVSYNVSPEDQEINLLFFEDNDIKQVAGDKLFEKGQKLVNDNYHGELVKPGEYHYQCKEKNKVYTVTLKNEKYSGQIHTSCNCDDTVNNIVNDWENKPEFAEALEILLLKDWSQVLKEKNQAFDNLYVQRVKEESKNSDPALADLRKDAVIGYEELVNHVSVHQILDDNPEYGEIVSEINKLIEKYNQIIYTRMGNGENPADVTEATTQDQTE